jgi:hypothetical protein
MSGQRDPSTSRRHRNLYKVRPVSFVKKERKERRRRTELHQCEQRNRPRKERRSLRQHPNPEQVRPLYHQRNYRRQNGVCAERPWRIPVKQRIDDSINSENPNAVDGETGVESADGEDEGGGVAVESVILRRRPAARKEVGSAFFPVYTRE